MIHLGRPDDALELVHLAQYGSRDCAGPRTQAMLYAMEARAHAALGNPGKCKRAARMAEATFAELEDATGPEPSWIRFFTEAELSSENAHSYRDLAYAAAWAAPSTPTSPRRACARPSTSSARTASTSVRTH